MKIALFASAALLALGLAACGGGEPTATPEGATAGAEVAAETTPESGPAPTAVIGETPPKALQPNELPADPVAYKKERHEKYEDLGKNFKVVMDNSKSSTPDMAAVNAAAIKIKGYADEMGSWFPPGTASEPGEPGAKSNIWSDRKGFNAAVAKLQAETDKLVLVTDAAGLKAQFPATGGACKNCHDTYREPHKDK